MQSSVVKSCKEVSLCHKMRVSHCITFWQTCIMSASQLEPGKITTPNFMK